MEEIQALVNKIETANVPWLPYGLVEGCYFRVPNVDPENNIAAPNFRMQPHCEAQIHDHHCAALA